jgi:hypothetical protein
VRLGRPRPPRPFLPAVRLPPAVRRPRPPTTDATNIIPCLSVLFTKLVLVRSAGHRSAPKAGLVFWPSHARRTFGNKPNEHGSEGRGESERIRFIQRTHRSAMPSTLRGQAGSAVLLGLGSHRIWLMTAFLRGSLPVQSAS